MIEEDILNKFIKGKSISTIVSEMERQDFDWKTKRPRHKRSEYKKLVEEIIIDKYKKGSKKYE